MQTLPGGDVFLGWGELPNFSEDTAERQAGLRRALHRAHRQLPRLPLSVDRRNRPERPVARRRAGLDRRVNLYASWNGATGVSAWRVLGGAGPGALKPLGTAPRSGFETRIPVHSNEPYFSVQALGPSGHRPRHLRRRSHAAASDDLRGSAWVPSSGFGAVR